MTDMNRTAWVITFGTKKGKYKRHKIYAETVEDAVNRFWLRNKHLKFVVDDIFNDLLTGWIYYKDCNGGQFMIAERYHKNKR